jgi:hypothetical protein
MAWMWVLRWAHSLVSEWVQSLAQSSVTELELLWVVDLVLVLVHSREAEMGLELVIETVTELEHALVLVSEQQKVLELGLE